MKAIIKVSTNSIRFSKDKRVEYKDLRIKISSILNIVPTRNPVRRPLRPKPKV